MFFLSQNISFRFKGLIYFNINFYANTTYIFFKYKLSNTYRLRLTG